MMRIPSFFLLLLLLLALPLQAEDVTTASPDGRIRVDFHCAPDESPSCPTLSVSCDGQYLFRGITLGLATDRSDLSAGLKLKSASQPLLHTDDYRMLTGKRTHCVNRAHERTLVLENAEGRSLSLVLRVYDDGVAFRYLLEDPVQGERLTADFTSYPLAPGRNRWMRMRTVDNEGFYPLATSVQTAAEYGYPALMEPCEGLFALLTEAALRRENCGSYLAGDSTGRYRVRLVDASVPLPAQGWASPWRLMLVGSLADVVESTLVTDVADPCPAGADFSWVEPGVASWVYWAHNHGTRDFQLLKTYVDLAADMGWKYSLIDWEWSQMSNGGTVEDIFAYAHARGVKPLLWYNSSTAWVGPGSPEPLYRLNRKEAREKEFGWLNEQGVSGVKVDFFPTDSLSVINYYFDILESAVRHRLLVNFHGGTLPWGWQRTYPNLVTLESVYGAEWYNNNATLTARAACHNATLPFTRNVIGSMDYTPGTFSDSQHPHITTHGHELALIVLFESGVQHMPDRPETYRALPEKVRHFLSALPVVWDDTRLLAGYPGQEVVLARRKGAAWYVAGINGTDAPAAITFSLRRLGLGKDAKACLFGDGSDGRSFVIRDGYAIDSEEVTVDCLPRGGFVLLLE